MPDDPPARPCWYCGADVLNPDHQLCSEACSRAYWGVEGAAAQTLPAGE